MSEQEFCLHPRSTGNPKFIGPPCLRTLVDGRCPVHGHDTAGLEDRRRVPPRRADDA